MDCEQSQCKDIITLGQRMLALPLALANVGYVQRSNCLNCNEDSVSVEDGMGDRVGGIFRLPLCCKCELFCSKCLLE